MDDVLRNLPDTLGVPQVNSRRIRSLVLVHNVSSLHQRDHRWILFDRDRRLGLVEGSMDDGHGILPHLVGRHCVLIHVADIFANT